MPRAPAHARDSERPNTIERLTDVYSVFQTTTFSVSLQIQGLCQCASLEAALFHPVKTVDVYECSTEAISTFEQRLTVTAQAFMNAAQMLKFSRVSQTKRMAAHVKRYWGYVNGSLVVL